MNTLEKPDQRSIYFSFFDKLPKEYADACKERYDEGRFNDYSRRELNCVANAVWNLSWGGDFDSNEIYRTAQEIDAANVSDAPESEEEKLRKIYFDFYDNLNINGERIDQYYIDTCKKCWDYRYAKLHEEPKDQRFALLHGFKWEETELGDDWFQYLYEAVNYQEKSRLPEIPTDVLLGKPVQSEQPSAHSINIDESAFELSHEEKIRYMDIATRIVGFNFHKKDLDLFVSLYELVIEKQGDSDLRDVSKIKSEVEERHKVIVEPKN